MNVVPRKFACKKCGRMTYGKYDKCLDCGAENSIDLILKDNGIKFCPHCGHSTSNQRLRTPLDSGADWECSKCGCYVEAYILDLD